MFRPELFFYRKKETIIHKLDPRSKMIYVLVMFILAVLRGDLYFLLAVFIASLIPIFIGKLLKNFLASLRAAWIFLFLIFILNYAFSRDIQLSSALSLRFLILISSFLVFSVTTSPDDLALALYKLRFPYEFVLILTLSVRFIPTLLRDSFNIVDAQRSRGLETQKGYLSRIRNYLPIIIPLLVIGIRRAINVAESMESRGFGASNRPIMLYDIKFSFIDVIFSSICILSLFLVIAHYYLSLI